MKAKRRNAMNKFAVEDHELLGPALGPYSEALVCDHLFFTGMAGTYGADGKLDPTVYEQTKQIFVNTKALLNKAGGDLKDIVNVTVYLENINDFDEMNRAYKEMLTERPMPARATVAVKELLPGIKVEMVITAYIP